MSDAAVAVVVTTVVTGVVTIIAQVCGVLVLWLKARQATVKVQDVEKKLDENTRTTEAVDQKADVIVEQTNGVTTALQTSVDQLLGRVEKLEAYNREASHRVLDAVHAMHLRLAAMAPTPPTLSESLPPQGPGGVP